MSDAINQMQKDWDEARQKNPIDFLNRINNAKKDIM